MHACYADNRQSCFPPRVEETRRPEAGLSDRRQRLRFKRATRKPTSARAFALAVIDAESIAPPAPCARRMVTFASSGPSIRNIAAIHLSHPFVARHAACTYIRACAGRSAPLASYAAAIRSPPAMCRERPMGPSTASCRRRRFANGRTVGRRPRGSPWLEQAALAVIRAVSERTKSTGIPESVEF